VRARWGSKDSEYGLLTPIVGTWYTASVDDNADDSAILLCTVENLTSEAP